MTMIANVERVVGSATMAGNGVTKIPTIVHQTCKSRCVTTKVAKAAHTWSALDDEWSYYLHDDEAVMRLLQQDFAEFPHMSDIVRYCVVHGTIMADLWRYVVLYVYGGIYADIDAVPAKFSPQMLRDDTDAFFVVEQYHLLSQWFMAASPRHPLMFYAIKTCLSNLRAAKDTGALNAAYVTGPHALHTAYIQFRKDNGNAVVDPAIPGNKPVRAGHFVGSYNRSVTVVGTAAFQNEYVNRDVLKRKSKEYQKMGMRHFSDDRKHASGVSCRASMLQAADVKHSSIPLQPVP